MTPPRARTYATTWLVAACACGAATPDHAAGEPTRTQVVARGRVQDRVLLTGELFARDAVSVSVPRTDVGQLSIRWLADDGTDVKQGDRVLELDNAAFVDQLEQDRIASTDAGNALEAARAISALDLATKATELDTRKLELAKATVKAGVPADLLPARDAQERQLELTRAKVAVDKAEKTLVAARSEAELDLRVKQIALDKAKHTIESAELAIRELVVTAPRDGLVVVGTHPWEGRKFRAGDLVEPGMTMLSLPDAAMRLDVHAQLSDVDDGRVAVGDTGTCTLDAYPGQPLACAIQRITPVARAASGRGSLRRTFEVAIELPTSDGTRMRPGMSVKVDVRHAATEAVVVPRGAVARDGEATRVRLASGELRDVELGACDEQVCAVAHGVGEGDRVTVGASP